MKTLLQHSAHNHSSHYVYHRQWGGTKHSVPEMEYGTVGAEQQEIQDANEAWRQYNEILSITATSISQVSQISPVDIQQE